MTELLLIGVGHPDRGDDAIGPLVARAVRAACPAGVRVLEAGGDLLALLEQWTGADVVVVDATRGAGAPGQVVRLTALDSGGPTFVSSHALDLASVVALGRALGRAPRELVVFGVEGREFAAGAPPSAEVTAALPGVVVQVLAELARLVTSADRSTPRAGG